MQCARGRLCALSVLTAPVVSMLFRFMHLTWSGLCLIFLVGCGASNEPPRTPEGQDSEEAGVPEQAAEQGVEHADAEEEGEQAEGGIPKKCFKNSDPCVPPPKFVEALCSDTYPGVTLHMFAPSAPWGRAYLRGKVKAWNASGGVSDNEAWLDFDEEVVLLRKRGGPEGGIQVSGAEGGYDALRWDGSCVTLDASEVTLSAPPKPKAAKVEWRFLDDATQEALRESDVVTKAYRSRRKECKGAVSGTVSKKCVVADARLSEVIVEHVRSGGSLGTPEKMP